jgi:hypothetical protein
LKQYDYMGADSVVAVPDPEAEGLYMKLTRLTTLAIAAAALAGTLGAQQQRGGNNHSAPRAQVSRAQAPRAQMSRAQAPRANYAENRARPDSRSNQYARPDVRGRADFGARGVPARNEVRGREDFNGRNDFRGRNDSRVAIADHGRPLITRAGFVGRAGFNGGIRFGAGFNRWGGRLVLPFGWENRIFVNGYFPAAYSTYCEAVPADYDYMLPDMQPNYDSCLFGDRIVVMDRFSRGIVFTAVLR